MSLWISSLRAAARFASKRKRLTAALIVCVALIAAWHGYEAWVGASPIIRRGGVVYFSVRQDAPVLPASVRTALEQPEVAATPGEVAWQSLGPGFDIAEQAVTVDDVEVERLFLTRVDPALYEFSLHIAADRDLDAWMRDLKPAALINASYYDPQGAPATPVHVDGQLLGPTLYEAQHGAFIAAPGAAHIVDLAGQDWRTAFGAAPTALVSYPLLLAEDGTDRAPDSRWLASRSFLAEDTEGRIILGSAPRGFFTLHRLAVFLRASGLGLRSALNLDGGPVACQGVDFGGATRRVYGRVEVQVDSADGPLRVLPSSRDIHALMPIVLAVYPRDAAESR